jgi:hypothetical protein
MKWNRTKLMYRKDDHQSWSGGNTCTQLMSAMVVTGKRRKIHMDEIKLDITEKLYPNDTVMLQNNLHDFASECTFRYTCTFRILIGHSRKTGK